MEYIVYNREERDICAHLFRLLLEDQPNWGPLKDFLCVEEVADPRIFCEVALIRDAYFVRKPHADDFINKLCDLIAEQHQIKNYTSFYNLPENINNPEKTHPKQIRYKMKEMGILNSKEDATVYGSLQAMFNAKPDLTICYKNSLIIFEAKYTLGFDNEQLRRTEQIGEAWAKILYEDLGFETKPDLQIKTLGLSLFSPDVSWEDVHRISKKYLSEDDFTLKVFSKLNDEFK